MLTSELKLRKQPSPKHAGRRNMRETIIILAAIAAIFGVIGYMNSADIDNCIKRGNSVQTCERTFNR